MQKIRQKDAWNAFGVPKRPFDVGAVTNLPLKQSTNEYHLLCTIKFDVIIFKIVANA